MRLRQVPERRLRMPQAGAPEIRSVLDVRDIIRLVQQPAGAKGTR